MFIVTLTYVRPLEELDTLMDAHVTWLKKHYASGLFVASGRQVPRKGGVILVRPPGYFANRFGSLPCTGALSPNCQPPNWVRR
jgi:uncharacterized protein YciI